MEQYFQGDTCIVACSGPSLNKVDVHSLKLPIVVISTAIRSIPNPDFWALADNLNNMHGTEGKNAWENTSIKKVIPESKIIKGDSSFIRVQYSSSGRVNEVSQTLFERGYPLIRGPHKTITFAIQWLHTVGIKKIIFAGNDLSADSFENKYSYKLESYDMRKKPNFKKTLDQVTKTMKVWYPIARQKGFEWYSWKCGHVFESMVPSFSEEMEKEYMEKGNFTSQVVELPKEKEVFVKDSERLLYRSYKKMSNSMNDNMKISESEWKEKCQKFLKTISR